MASNPLIAQGVLNRLVSNVVVTNYSALDVTPPYLNKSAIKLSLTGPTTTSIPTMTGLVQSPEPYQEAEITIALLRTQTLAASWKLQMETTSLIGPVNVISDAVNFPQYSFANCSIKSVREMSFAGDDPGFVLVLSGIYYINANLWNAV